MTEGVLTKNNKTVMSLASSLRPVDNETAKDVVPRGYAAQPARYDEAYGGETKYRDWLVCRAGNSCVKSV
ncbi:hypothetical protein GCM10009789_83740 [Kribbella sancticallisti]|uniref:Uncharacterized protein n=1 Tax=Kribbella sancticallisti TaxID=460087 RepID=A0ABP4QRZ4_9ACTN